jgi:hypothetical protein
VREFYISANCTQPGTPQSGPAVVAKFAMSARVRVVTRNVCDYTGQPILPTVRGKRNLILFDDGQQVTRASRRRYRRLNFVKVWSAPQNETRCPQSPERDSINTMVFIFNRPSFSQAERREGAHPLGGIFVCPFVRVYKIPCTSKHPRSPDLGSVAALRLSVLVNAVP